MEEPRAGQLRRELAQADAEREAALLEFEALRRGIDSHLRRLGSAVDAAENGKDGLEALARELDADLLSGGPSAEATTSEVLRASAAEAQRRCRDLGGDLDGAAAGNEELAAALRAARAMTQKLCQEVQRQTEELAAATGQHLLDVERLEQLQETCRREQSVWQRDADRELLATQQQCQEEVAKVRDRHAARWAAYRGRGRALGRCAGSLRSEHRELQDQVQTFSQALAAGLAQLGEQFARGAAQLLAHLDSERARLAELDDEVQIQLRMERERRQADSVSWAAKHGALAAEASCIVERHDRDAATMQGRVDTVLSAGEAEAFASRKAVEAMHDQLAALAGETAAWEAQLPTLLRRRAGLERRLAADREERSELRGTVDSLRQQVDTAGAALEGELLDNRSLRQGMEEQRVGLLAASRRELSDCRAHCEASVGVQAQAHAAKLAQLTADIQAAQEACSRKSGEAQAARDAFEEGLRARSTLQRDVALWRGQHELAAKMKAEVDREFALFQQQAIGTELRAQQEQHDQLLVKKARLEGKRAGLAEEVRQIEQETKAREAAAAEQGSVVADLRRQAGEEVRRARERLGEVERSLIDMRAQGAISAQQSSERQSALQRLLADERARSAAAAAELARGVEAERAAGDALRRALQELQGENAASCRRACEGSATQVAALERAIEGARRSAEAELADLGQQRERLQSRMAELEGELALARRRLAQAEQEVGEGTSRVALAKSSGRAAKEALERELAAKAEELEQRKALASQRAEELLAVLRDRDDTRQRLELELADVSSSAGPAPRVAASFDRSRTLSQSLPSLRSGISWTLEGDTEASALSSTATPGGPWVREVGKCGGGGGWPCRQWAPARGVVPGTPATALPRRGAPP